MKPTLVIMAAGMASRYGSMKQIQQFGPSGETIMDYSIYDAVKAGFGKVVFIIRKDFADDFKAIFEPKLKGRIETEYVYQELDAFMGATPVPADRKKPWGTAHAILCAHNAVSGPFAVINADDFYGEDAFVKANNFLVMECREDLYGIIAYRLANTLSDHGTVSRGVIDEDANNEMVGINERLKVYRDNGQMVDEQGDTKLSIVEEAKASMNFWCFHPSIFPYIREEFAAFLGRSLNDPKAEFLIPFVADQFIKSGRGKIKVIPTNAPWFGVTYKEDAPIVQQKLNGLIGEKTYPNKLW
ncbi:nucleotidyltransferase [Flavisolibacter ginsenosidimutans]|uniref:Nucleotidyltransferase n=1 Tax=Flavisolibacter ginsenosidimutans TaxID=661481 RepID=A0A5B8UQF6_9BACT|nr:nucleotidyltransferase [Flavisolibacter ginsenosidimutans]QEC58220.1 nucleotidyltransferase [Flavisolibacter ginsenosidimutans]